MLLYQPLYGGGFWVAFAQVSLVYYAAAMLLHYIVPALLPVSSVQKGQRSQGQVSREAFLSLGPLAVKAGMWVIVENLHASNRSLLYDGPIINSPINTLYALMTVVALDYLHDTWFYWTHRILHWGPIYRKVHYMHHLSTVPTAFTGYSFHLGEAALVFANEVIVCYLFPIHVGLHRVYHLYTTIIHNGGHAGYEIAPFIPTIEALVAGILQIKHSLFLNTVRHHDMHHRHPKVHFSLYFGHWDRWMGTEHAKYRSL